MQRPTERDRRLLSEAILFRLQIANLIVAAASEPSQEIAIATRNFLSLQSPAVVISQYMYSRTPV